MVVANMQFESGKCVDIMKDLESASWSTDTCWTLGIWIHVDDKTCDALVRLFRERKMYYFVDSPSNGEHVVMASQATSLLVTRITMDSLIYAVELNLHGTVTPNALFLVAAAHSDACAEVLIGTGKQLTQIMVTRCDTTPLFAVGPPGVMRDVARIPNMKITHKETMVGDKPENVYVALSEKMLPRVIQSTDTNPISVVRVQAAWKVN